MTGRDIDCSLQHSLLLYLQSAALQELTRTEQSSILQKDLAPRPRLIPETDGLHPAIQIQS